MSPKPIAWAWLDMEGRVWMDTGHVDPKSREPLIELLNGAARGRLSWVEKECGPLEQLGAEREPRLKNAVQERQADSP